MNRGDSLELIKRHTDKIMKDRTFLIKMMTSFHNPKGSDESIFTVGFTYSNYRHIANIQVFLNIDMDVLLETIKKAGGRVDDKDQIRIPMDLESHELFRKLLTEAVINL
jgi:hypothetical protein